MKKTAEIKFNIYTIKKTIVEVYEVQASSRSNAKKIHTIDPHTVTVIKETIVRKY